MSFTMNLIPPPSTLSLSSFLLNSVAIGKSGASLSCYVFNKAQMSNTWELETITGCLGVPMLYPGRFYSWTGWPLFFSPSFIYH